MSVRRIITCDGCGDSYVEEDFGTGFPGWCIVQGIAKSDPPSDRPLRQEDTQCTFCPPCKMRLAAVIDDNFWKGE